MKTQSKNGFRPELQVLEERSMAAMLAIGTIESPIGREDADFTQARRVLNGEMEIELPPGNELANHREIGFTQPGPELPEGYQRATPDQEVASFVEIGSSEMVLFEAADGDLYIDRKASVTPAHRLADVMGRLNTVQLFDRQGAFRAVNVSAGSDFLFIRGEQFESDSRDGAARARFELTLGFEQIEEPPVTPTPEAKPPHSGPAQTVECCRDAAQELIRHGDALGAALIRIEGLRLRSGASTKRRNRLRNRLKARIAAERELIRRSSAEHSGCGLTPIALLSLNEVELERAIFLGSRPKSSGQSSRGGSLAKLAHSLATVLGERQRLVDALIC